MLDRLHFGDLARQLFLAGGELVDRSCHLFLTGGDPVDAARYLLLSGSDASCDPVNALPHLIEIERYCVELNANPQSLTAPSPCRRAPGLTRDRNPASARLQRAHRPNRHNNQTSSACSAKLDTFTPSAVR